MELPRIDYGRRNARHYRYAYFAGTGGDWLDQLAKIDVETGSRTTWSAPGCYPGEPIFVREPGATARTRAWSCRSCSTRPPAARSWSVLDARSFEELARAEAPHHIPFGFHGQFVGG